MHTVIAQMKTFKSIYRIIIDKFSQTNRRKKTIIMTFMEHFYYSNEIIIIIINEQNYGDDDDDENRSIHSSQILWNTKTNLHENFKFFKSKYHSF